MELTTLFSMQRILDEHIAKEHPNTNNEDRFRLKRMALLVELGELANEIRFFKFWSNDRTPRTKVVKAPTMNFEDREYCNLVLEELVDVLHFILSLGNDLDVVGYSNTPLKCKSLTKQFEALYRYTNNLGFKHEWYVLFSLFLGLVEYLDFSWEQIQHAYIEKNKVNHLRQHSGY